MLPSCCIDSIITISGIRDKLIITIEIIHKDNIISRWTIVSKFYPEGYCTTCAIDARRDFISSEDSGRSPEIKIRSLDTH